MLRSFSSTLKAIVSCLVVLALCSSFGLHALQVHHEHFSLVHTHGNHDDGGEQNHTSGFQTIEAAFHASDKKLYSLVVRNIFSVPAFLINLNITAILLLFALYCTSVIRERHEKRFRIFDYLSLYFRKGIYHSRAF